MRVLKNCTKEENAVTIEVNEYSSGKQNKIITVSRAGYLRIFLNMHYFKFRVIKKKKTFHKLTK